MTTLPVAWLPALLAAVVAVSPLLASWTATLEAGGAWRWWQPRCVTPRRWVAVGAVATALSLVGAATGGPWLAWVSFAVGGAVLSTVDLRAHLLPARFLYPLAAVIGAVLIVAACLTGSAPALLRAVLAGLVVGVAWLVIALASPAAIGLGDVRLFAISAGLLGWFSWPAVFAGQFLTFLLAPVVALVMLPVGRSHAMKVTHVPMGPSSVVATIVIGWLMRS